MSGQRILQEMTLEIGDGLLKVQPAVRSGADGPAVQLRSSEIVPARLLVPRGRR
jgi:hypothetical protein